jgi:hypothetical protein
MFRNVCAPHLASVFVTFNSFVAMNDMYHLKPVFITIYMLRVSKKPICLHINLAICSFIQALPFEARGSPQFLQANAGLVP